MFFSKAYSSWICQKVSSVCACVWVGFQLYRAWFWALLCDDSGFKASNGNVKPYNSGWMLWRTGKFWHPHCCVCRGRTALYVASYSAREKHCGLPFRSAGKKCSKCSNNVEKHCSLYGFESLLCQHTEWVQTGTDRLWPHQWVTIECIHPRLILKYFMVKSLWTKNICFFSAALYVRIIQHKVPECQYV